MALESGALYGLGQEVAFLRGLGHFTDSGVTRADLLRQYKGSLGKRARGFGLRDELSFGDRIVLESMVDKCLAQAGNARSESPSPPD